MAKVTVKNLIEDLGLKVLTGKLEKAEEIVITEKEVNRPGIQLAGYFDYFTPERIQVIGKTEYTFFGSFSMEHREKALEEYFSYKMPLIVVTRGMALREDFNKFAKGSDIIVCSTESTTTRFINKLSSYLEDKMAPFETIHGVMVDINGVGVLIRGESSIGKSETALELVQNGNRLVADDAVEIRRIDDGFLSASAPELLRHYLEIRGIGIIDVKKMYGARAVKPTKKVDILVYLENWNPDKFYDRLGLDREYEEILGVRLEKLIVPVKPGRNTAMVLEVAAMNYRQREMGDDAALEFSDKLMNEIEKNKQINKNK